MGMPFRTHRPYTKSYYFGPRLFYTAIKLVLPKIVFPNTVVIRFLTDGDFGQALIENK